MVVEQAYYTSCKTGLRGSHGFQMNAASSGLDSGTLNFMERFGGYAPPLSQPTSPTDQELENFPVSLTFLKAPDGSAILCRSKYIGKDYSGRYGNFFTHFLRYKNSSEFVRNASPISFWNSRIWKQESVAHTELPQLELKHSETGPDMGQIKTFLASNGRVNHLKAFLASVHKALESKRRIIIVESSDAIASWIAAAACALPNALLEELTFTTYTKNPYNTFALVNGTTSDSDFAFSPSEIQYQYFVFDFENNRFSEPPADSVFSLAMYNWLTANPAECGKFKKFADSLEANWNAGDLNQLVDLYNFAFEKGVSPDIARASIRFIIEKQLFTLPDLMILVTAVISDGSYTGKQDRELINDLFSAVLTSANSTPEQREDIIRFYIDWFINKILPDSDKAILDETSAIFNLHKIEETWWTPDLPAIRHVMETARELTWLNAFIDFAAGLGLLDQFEMSVNKSLNLLLLPRINDEAAQNILARLFETGLFHTVDDAMLKFTAGRLEAVPDGAAAPAFLTRPSIILRLKSLCLEQKDLRLYLRLCGYETAHSKNKAQNSAAIIQSLPAQFGSPLPAGALDDFFRFAWPESVINIKDAVFLVDNFSESILANDLFLLFTLNSLLNSAELIKPEPNSQAAQLIKTIAGYADTPKIKLPQTIIEKKKLCVNLLNWKTLYRGIENTSDKYKIISGALELIPLSNNALREFLVHFAVSDYCRTGDTESKKIMLFNHLNEFDSPLFWLAVEKALPDFSAKQPMCPTAWLQLFRLFADLPKDGAVKRDRWDKPLRKLLSFLAPEQQQAIDEKLKKDEEYKAFWIEWNSKKSLSGGLLKKIFGF